VATTTIEAMDAAVDRWRPSFGCFAGSATKQNWNRTETIFCGLGNRCHADGRYQRASDQPRGIGYGCDCKNLIEVIPARSPDGDVLKTVAAFCAVGLVVSLLVASYGLDLSGGFF
jgi:hypothetical protein